MSRSGLPIAITDVDTEAKMPLGYVYVEPESSAMMGGTAAAELPTYTLVGEEDRKLVVALADSGLCKSRAEARRLIVGGGMRVNGERVQDPDYVLSPGVLGTEGAVVQVGKKRAARLVQGGTGATHLLRLLLEGVLVREWVYVFNAEAADAWDQGNVIARDLDFGVGAFDGVLAADAVTAHGILGVAQHTIPAGSYGFILRRGVGKVLADMVAGRVIVSAGPGGFGRGMDPSEEHCVFGVALEDSDAGTSLADAWINCPESYPWGKR